MAPMFPLQFGLKLASSSAVKCWCAVQGAWCLLVYHSDLESCVLVTVYMYMTMLQTHH